MSAQRHGQNTRTAISEVETVYLSECRRKFVESIEFLDITPINTDKPAVSLEEMFDACMEVHNDTVFGGANIMKTEVEKRYSNVTEEIIVKFLDYIINCKEYNEIKSKLLSLPIFVLPISTTSQQNHIYQIDMIDMQHFPDGELKWILNVHNISTGSCNLRALKSNSAVEIARVLCDLFFEQGAPTKLITGYCNELKEIQEFRLLWPQLEIDNENIEAFDRRENIKTNILNILETCACEKKIYKWSFLLRQAQNLKNINNTNDQRVITTPLISSYLITSPPPAPPLISFSLIKSPPTETPDVSSSLNSSPLPATQYNPFPSSSDSSPATPQISKDLNSNNSFSFNSDFPPATPKIANDFNSNFEQSDDLLKKCLSWTLWDENEFLSVVTDISIDSPSESNQQTGDPNIEMNANSQPKKTLAKMFTDYRKLSNDISLFMWKLDRQMLRLAFTIYKIRTNVAPEKQNEESNLQARKTLHCTQRRLSRCLKGVEPSIKGHFCFYNLINSSLYFNAIQFNRFLFKVFVIRYVTASLRAATAKTSIVILAIAKTVIQKTIMMSTKTMPTAKMITKILLPSQQTIYKMERKQTVCIGNFYKLKLSSR